MRRFLCRFSAFEALGNGLLAASSADGTVQAWDAATGRELWKFAPEYTEATGCTDINVNGQGADVAGACYMKCLSHCLLACWGEQLGQFNEWAAGNVRVRWNDWLQRLCNVSRRHKQTESRRCATSRVAKQPLRTILQPTWKTHQWR